MSPVEKPTLKVVARLRDGNLLRGFLANTRMADFEDILRGDAPSIPEEIGVCAAESKEMVSVPLDSLKALFFVRSFEGRREYKEVKFFDSNPPIRGLWVRVQFYDNEYLEGIVKNSLHYLVNPGFFLKPPDPQSNNEILYVVKNSLREFRVMGVRMDY